VRKAPAGHREPLVSVVLPVHNGSRFLSEALDCLLAQTYSSVEILAYDDASTDDSWIQLTGARDINPAAIKLSGSEENVGVSLAARRAVELADPSSRYLLFFAQDDVLPRHFIEEMVRTQQRTGAVLVSACARRVDASGHDLGSTVAPALLPPWVGLATQLLRARNVVCGTGALVRRDAYCPHYLDEANNQAQDWEHWIRLSRMGSVSVCLRTNAFYRVHSTSLSQGPGSTDYFTEVASMHKRLNDSSKTCRGNSSDAPGIRSWVACAARKTLERDLRRQANSLQSPRLPLEALQPTHGVKARTMSRWSIMRAVGRSTASLYRDLVLTGIGVRS
jgi:hypothetical protein